MRVLKTDIRVDDSWRDYEMGDVVHVGHQSFGYVSVWWLDTVSGQKLAVLPTRRLCVFGTGHYIPELDSTNDDHPTPVYRGTAIDVGSRLVWHLFEDVL